MGIVQRALAFLIARYITLYIELSSGKLRVIEELRQVIPVPFPGSLNHRIFVIPLFSEFFQGFMAASGINRRIDFFQVTADSLQVFVRNELCRIPDHMDNTMLNMRIGKDCFHSIRKSCKPVHTGNENIFCSHGFLCLLEHSSRTLLLPCLQAKDPKTLSCLPS